MRASPILRERQNGTNLRLARIHANVFAAHFAGNDSRPTVCQSISGLIIRALSASPVPQTVQPRFFARLRLGLEEIENGQAPMPQRHPPSAQRPSASGPRWVSVPIMRETMSGMPGKSASWGRNRPAKPHIFRCPREVRSYAATHRPTQFEDC